MRDQYADMLRDEPIDALHARYRYLSGTLGEQTGDDYHVVAYWLGLVRTEIESRERVADPVDDLYRRIGSFDIERIKSAHRISDVVGLMGNVELIREGRRLKARCPLPDHPGIDATPSLMVYPDSESFYCYGCGQGGDVLRFVTLLIPRYSFRDACTALIEVMGGRTADYQRRAVPQSRQGRVRVI